MRRKNENEMNNKMPETIGELCRYTQRSLREHAWPEEQFAGIDNARQTIPGRLTNAN